MAANVKSPAVTAVATGGAQNLYATNELPVDMHPRMMDSYSSLTPLTKILTQMAEDPSTNYRVDWQEKKNIPTYLVQATTESSASTSLYVVDNGDTVVADTLVYNPRTDDMRLVSSNETDNTLTVVVSQGGTTSSAGQSGDIWHVLPPSLAENDESYRAKSVADENIYNLHQLVKLQYGITRIGDKMKTHFGGAGSKREELKSQKYREYREKKEKLAYFGGRATGGTAPATKRQAGGLTYYLRTGTLYKDFNGILTESGWRSWVGDYKDQNPDATNIWFFGAGNVIDIIDGWGLDKVRLTPESKTYGLDILTYRNRGMTVKLVALPLLDIGVTKGWGWLLDMERIRLKTLDRDMFYPEAKNIGESEIIYDTYRGVYTIMIANESRHAMCTGALL